MRTFTRNVQILLLVSYVLILLLANDYNQIIIYMKIQSVTINIIYLCYDFIFIVWNWITYERISRYFIFSSSEDHYVCRWNMRMIYCQFSFVLIQSELLIVNQADMIYSWDIAKDKYKKCVRILYSISFS